MCVKIRQVLDGFLGCSRIIIWDYGIKNIVHKFS